MNQLVDFIKIRQIRQEKNLSQTVAGDHIGLSRPSYALVETGAKELTVQQFYKLADLLETRPQDLMAGIKELSKSYTDYEKFKQVILACINLGSDSDGKITKTKLAKLVYLSDFNWFYFHKQSMTGAIYRAIQRGPVADDYFRIIDKLFEEQAIAIEPKGAALLISAIENPTLDKLSSKERDLIEKICSKWRNGSTQEIVSFTHNQMPYKKTNVGDPISYKEILKEDPANLF